ncbi:MAG: inorganic phosphate transporter, partial [Chlamydiota bacterium]
MEITTILLILAIVFGFYMAWSLGSNDAANAVGTAVGSGAITLRKAVIIAAVCEFGGAFLLGGNVSATVQTGIVNPEFFIDTPLYYAYGMLGALLAAGLWLQLASYLGWPVSTTHSIIGAVLGFGLVAGGVHTIHWGQVSSIVLSWVISPLMGATISYIIFSYIRRRIFYASHPTKAAGRIIPFLAFIVLTILPLVMLSRGLKNFDIQLTFMESLAISAGIGLLGAIVFRFLTKQITPRQIAARPAFEDIQVVKSMGKVVKHLNIISNHASGELQADAYKILSQAEKIQQNVKCPEEAFSENSEFMAVERIFGYLQLVSVCFMAFAHGANDVANAIGPLSACIAIFGSGEGIAAIQPTVPLWILALGGTAIIIGLATWGWRVIETVGRRITELTPSRGFAAELGAATTIVLASKMGLPISTTHTLVGAIFGVGLARGIHALNLNTIRDIILS